MRKISKTRRKKQKKILIISTLSLLLFLCVGYAAFQTNLSITAKGNVVEKAMTPEELKDLVVNSGDDLYADEYETGRYIYKGSSPNNYIIFNNEMWRILSVEKDGTIKIIKNDNLESMAFDSQGYRDSSSNGVGGTYCAVARFGCNAWSISDNFNNGTFSGTVLKDAEINTYLNGIYLSSLSDSNLVVDHNWNIGSVSNDEDLASQIVSESLVTWSGKIGLMTSSEYLRANNNIEQCDNTALNNANAETCITTNWIYKICPENNHLWTITPHNASRFDVIVVISVYGHEGGVYGNNARLSHYSFSPALYLSSEITLSGTGQENDPYQIKKA